MPASGTIYDVDVATGLWCKKLRHVSLGVAMQASSTDMHAHCMYLAVSFRGLCNPRNKSESAEEIARIVA